MDLGDEGQVMHQGAQLGRRAQVQPYAIIDVERLRVVVSIDAQQIPLWTVLVQREAIDDAAQVFLAAKQMLAIETSSARVLRLAKLLERFGHGLLGVCVKRARDRHIEAVEVIEAGNTQVLREPSPYGAGSLMIREGAGVCRQTRRAQGDRYVQCRIA